MKTDSSLILVSNAEPYAHYWNEDEEIEQEKLAGGLTPAMDPLLQEAGGTWVAWGREEADFEVLDSENKVRVPDENGYDLRRLSLSEEEVEEFYLGFSNEILWPLSRLSSINKIWMHVHVAYSVFSERPGASLSKPFYWD